MAQESFTQRLRITIWKCDRCSQIFKSERSYEHHKIECQSNVRADVLPVPANIDILQVNLPDSNEVAIDPTGTFNGMPYHCPLCTREFNSQGSLNRHLATCRRKQNNEAVELQTLSVQQRVKVLGPTPI